MTMMNADSIRSAIAERILVIRDFSEDCLEPASYNFRLGNEAITSTQREKVDPSQKGLLTIPAGDFALVKTMELVDLSPRVAGHIGLRSHYAKRGLDMLAGPQIDPGFKGYLVVGLTNLSPRDITMAYGEQFCTVEFYQFPQDVSAPYQGEYQGQAGISGKDLEALVDAQGMTFGEVIRSLATLNATVSDLSRQVKLMAWGTPAVVMTGVAVIGVLVALR